MVIDKVHGLHATGVSLNDRFTMLATVVPTRVATRARRRTPNGTRNNINFKNSALIEQIARRLQWQEKRAALRQRLGVGPGALRRFGSESSLPGLRRSNSFGNISQANGARNQGNWRGSNANLSRSASFNNLSQAAGRGRQMRRGFRRRGGADWALRGRFRGGVRGGRVTRPTQRPNVAGRGRGAARGRGAGRGRGGQARQGAQATAGRGGPMRGRGGATRGRGQGGVGRPQVPSKEELDLQLDQYMASTKSALDKELDAYMKNAMEME